MKSTRHAGDKDKEQYQNNHAYGMIQIYLTSGTDNGTEIDRYVIFIE